MSCTVYIFLYNTTCHLYNLLYLYNFFLYICIIFSEQFPQGFVMTKINAKTSKLHSIRQSLPFFFLNYYKFFADLGEILY